jgi:hypothetical protein
MDKERVKGAAEEAKGKEPKSVVKRSVMIPLLRDAALRLADAKGIPVVIAPIDGTDVTLAELNFTIWRNGSSQNLEVWDLAQSGKKVLNINWGADHAIEVVSFRRGGWEDTLLRLAVTLH